MTKARKAGAVRLTQAAVDAHNARVGSSRTPAAASAPAAAGGLQRFQAIGRAPKSDLNKTEQEYAGILAVQQLAGEITWWKAHPFNVRLADNTFYEIDFLVMLADGRLEIHETKGEYTTDKGQMKIKLCAEVLPVIPIAKMIKLAKKNGGGWKREDY